MKKLCLALRLLIVLVILLFSAFPVFADTNVNITVTATPAVTGGITNFVVTYISDTQLDLSWTLIGDATNIMIRGKYGEYPDDIPDQFTEPSDGYLVYYGNTSPQSDTSMNLDENAGILYYKAWAQKADTTWYVSTATGEQEGIGMTLIALVILAAGLTTAMFLTKQMMLGFPCVIMWAILGVYAYDNSTIPWGDWQYYLFFASAFGMTTFCAFAAYALRTKKEEKAEGDQLIDEGADKGIRFIDEVPNKQEELSPRVKRVRDNAERRRTQGIRRPFRL